MFIRSAGINSGYSELTAVETTEMSSLSLASESKAVEGSSKFPLLPFCLLVFFSFFDSISSTEALTTTDDVLETFGLSVSLVLFSVEYTCTIIDNE